MNVVTSWDDGHPADLRVAELLNRHQLRGTFFVPIKNSEGRSVLRSSELRDLDTQHEIGSHTYSHTRLDTLTHVRIHEEILSGKTGLEDVLGHSVDGFCYPGGVVTPYAVECLRQNEFHYARTIENFRLDKGEDKFRVPTTIQAFQHSKPVYVRNFVKRANRLKRTYCFWRAVASDSVWEVMEKIATASQNSTAVFHLWGHSWEIEENDLWTDLDNFFAKLGRLGSNSQTVAQCVAVSTDSVDPAGS